MEKKYQIFISSTYDDLKDARRKVQDAVLAMYHFPVGMELFGAADEEQWEIIKETIDSSDYYVLIIAQRYGSIIQTGPEKRLQEIVILNNKIRELEDENKTLKLQLVERKPGLSIGINYEGIWKVQTKQIARPEYILENYRPLSLSDALGPCRGKVTQEQIDEYNKGLPSKQVLEEYINKLLIYKYETEATVEFEFYVENCGNCKANDINIVMEFPNQLLVLERNVVNALEEPKAPRS